MDEAGEVDVFLVWDDDGARRFIWPKTRLQREIDELQPNVGDEIAIVRGNGQPVERPGPEPDAAVRGQRVLRPLPDEEPAAGRAGGSRRRHPVLGGRDV